MKREKGDVILTIYFYIRNQSNLLKLAEIKRIDQVRFSGDV